MIVLWIFLGGIASAAAQVSVGIGMPGVSIGINLPAYPQLVRVPGYPVYYAPQMNSNYFFYDGLYWVYQRDNWYASSWYNGPWGMVGPEAVPLYVLRVPVRYYRQPPVYFRGWRSDAPPRWDEHWGNSWSQSRSGWNNWNHSSVPAPAPLPSYQRQYSGNRYPQAEQQQALQIAELPLPAAGRRRAAALSVAAPFAAAATIRAEVIRAAGPRQDSAGPRWIARQGQGFPRQERRTSRLMRLRSVR